MKSNKHGIYITNNEEAVELWVHGKMIVRSRELNWAGDLS